MATACKITPRVRDDKGLTNNSRLHQDLRLFGLDSGKLNTVWDMSRKLSEARRLNFSEESVKQTESLMEDGRSVKEMRFDENGEPLVDDLLGLTKLGDTVSDTDIVRGLSEMSADKVVNIPKKEGSDSRMPSMEEMLDVLSIRQSAEDFNRESPLSGRVNATVTYDKDSGDVSMRFESVRRRAEAELRGEPEGLSKEAADKGAALHGRVEAWLEKCGIGVGALTEAEAAAGVDGVTDYSATRRTAKGLVEIVRVAHGEKGRTAITEEAAHVAIASLVGKNANIDRAIGALAKDEAAVRRILDGEYDRYSELYHGDAVALAHEAAGHLLRDALVSEDAIDKSGQGRFKSLWRRVVDAVKGFFARFDESPLELALRQSQVTMRKTARDILDGRYFAAPDFSEEVKSIGSLFAVSKETQAKVDDIVKRMMADSRTRMRRIPGWMRARKGNKADKDETYFDQLSSTVKNMEKLTEEGKGLAAMEAYLGRAAQDLMYHLNTFERRYKKAKSLESKAYILNNIDIQLRTYERVLADVDLQLDELSKTVETAEDKDSMERIMRYIHGSKGEATGGVTPGLASLIHGVKAKIAPCKVPLFVEYVSKFVDIKNIIVPKFGKAYGKKGGETVSLAEQMMESQEMGGVDHWLLGASLSNVFPVQVFQRMLNIFKLKVREEWIDYRKQLQELTLELEQAGHKDQDFMFERKDGKLTGKYVANDSAEYRAFDGAQRKYYDAVMAIKDELDHMLPPGMRELLNSPKIRGDFMERLEGDEKLKDVLKDKLKEQYSVMSDDEYVMKEDKVLVDYDGNKIHVLPLRFLQFANGEDLQAMSTDVTKTLTRYAQMCCNYSVMGRILPVMELGRSIIAEGKDTSKKTVADENGDKVEVASGKTREQSGSSTLDRVDDILAGELYGFRSENVETEIYNKTVSLTRIGQKLMALTAWSQYMLSPGAAVQNDITARLQLLVASAEGKYIDKSDLLWAKGVFTKNIPSMFSDVGQRVPAEKISLFNELFNVMQKDGVETFRHRNAKRVGVDDLYFMTTMGEYHANTVLSLAMAHRVMLRTAGGEKVNLWDALEVVDMAEKKRRDAARLRKEGRTDEAAAIIESIAKHPEWKGSRNKHLVLREGVTKEDGTEFTFTKPDGTSDAEAFTRKAMHASHLLNGIYNTEDSAKWQRYIGGQMLGMYRKWIAPAWYKRMNGLNYSLDQGEWSEGYYRTFFKYGWMRLKSTWDKAVAADLKGHELTDMERKNLRAATTELILWLSLCGLTAMLKAGKKERKRSFLYNQLYYFTARSLSEVGSMTPQGVLPESLRTIQNPSAVLPVVNNMFSFFSAFGEMAMSPFQDDGEDVIRSGKYKGWHRWQRDMSKVPFVPVVRPWMSFLHPDDAVRFYE